MAANVPAVNVPFAFAPALAIPGLLDYSRGEHVKIFRGAIKPVSETPFDCEPDGLHQFLKDVHDRADEMGWTKGILRIAAEENEDDEDNTRENLIDHYGSITLERIIETEEENVVNQGREAQDTYMLYKCLMASLTADARKKVTIWSSQYRIGEGDDTTCGGVALLKIIIRESHLDTNATTNQIRTKLSNLDAYILTVDSDIGRFNQYVKLLIQSLTARNQTTSDLLINLFKGYGAVSDEVFRAWLLRKQDDHEEGEELTSDELMLAAKNKFDTMKEKGIWNAPTAEEKIIALEAKFDSTVKNLNKKVSFERNKKGGGGGKKHLERGVGRRMEIQETRTATILRSGQRQSQGTRRKQASKAIPGIGAARIPAENVRNGVPTNQKNVRALPNQERQREEPRKEQRIRSSTWRRNSKSPKHTSRGSKNRQLRLKRPRELRAMMNDSQGGTELQLQ